MSKYNNIKCYLNGLKFDSRLERRRYIYLINWQYSGTIHDLTMQTCFKLSGNDDKSWAKRKYYADFTYTYKGKLVIEDVKSSYTAANPTFRAKKERMKELGFYVKEVYKDYIPFLEVPDTIQLKYKLFQRRHARRNRNRSSQVF